MRMSYKWVKTYRDRVRNSVYGGYGSACAICGYSKCFRALQLHHVDKSQKSFAISRWTCHNFEEILDEATKCVMLCANCHSEVEDGMTELPANVRRFDRSIAVALKEITKIRKRKKNLCIDCGTVIATRSTRCAKCHSASRKSPQNHCAKCGNDIGRKSTRCVSCANKNRRK